MIMGDYYDYYVLDEQNQPVACDLVNKLQSVYKPVCDSVLERKP